MGSADLGRRHLHFHPLTWTFVAVPVPQILRQPCPFFLCVIGLETRLSGFIRNEDSYKYEDVSTDRSFRSPCYCRPST
ncbi:hypothetical protein LSAT2_031363 [Lamellibrachia satsuma]|nr:hypothetical protein LSAT2_031363 [Lamellibrachia satsuma]